MTESEAKALIRKHGWLVQEADWLREAVLSRAILRRFAPNEFTFHAGDESGGIFGVVAGGFGILLPSGSREMVVVHIVRLGVWFGHGPALTRQPRSMSFRAVEPSLALHLPMSSLAEIKAQHPEFGQRLAALSERNYSVVATRVIGDLLLPSSERRIAACLARMSRPEVSAERLPPWPIHLTQSELGRVANTSRDRTSLALQKFAANGWIDIKYRVIFVRDIEALEQFASEGGE